MELKYGFSILFSNLGQTVKLIVWRLISMLITVGVASAILIPLWNVFSNTTDMLLWVEAIKTAISEFLHGNSSIASLASNLPADVTSLIMSLTQNAGAFTGLIFGAIAIYFVYCFVLGLSYYPVADMINGRMSSNLKIGFASNMALNFKKAVRYSGARVIISLPIDILIATITGALTLGLFKVISVGVAPITLLVLLMFVTMRSMLFAGWLPRMIYHPEERVFINFARSLTSVKYNMRSLCKAYSVTFIISYVLGAVSLFPTCGLGLLVVPAVYYYILRAVELIGYFKLNGLSFYVDSTRVVDTVEFGYRRKNQEQIDTVEEVEQGGFSDTVVDEDC